VPASAARLDGATANQTRSALPAPDGMRQVAIATARNRA
jgi:hypothetical protein